MTETPPGALPLPLVPGLTDLTVFARGGYATVYRAVQQSVGREVAVKVENRTLDSAQDQARFLREARAAGRMSSHPHVVDLFDAGVTVDRHPYLIMELCDGSYAERMRTSPLRADEARDLGVKIADALAHAHASGVLHRDVKPANILYSHFNPAVLADFGLAVLGEMRDSTVTLEVLTPAYAAPEMFSHSPPSPAVDSYALCATLYAVMHGRPPRWRENQNPSLITLLEMFRQPVPDLPGVPPPLLDVLRAGMANDPAARPAPAQLRDMLAALSLRSRSVTSGHTGSPVIRHAGHEGHTGHDWHAGPDGRQGGRDDRQGGPADDGWNPGALPGQGPAQAGEPRLAAAQAGPRLAAAQAGPRPAARGPNQPFHDTQPTVPSTSPSRRARWFIGGVAALALVASVGAGIWVASAGTDPGPGPSATPAAGGTATASATVPATGPATPGVGAGGALPGCLVPLQNGGRCPTTLECFGPVGLRGRYARAEQVPCDRRHTWESYAYAELPDGVEVDHAQVRADPAVRRVCSASTFVRVTLLDPTGWNLEVLPPTQEDFADGDRTYRCLAGRGYNELTRPTLAG